MQGATVEVYENTSTSVLNFDCDLVGESSSSLWVYGFRRDDGRDTSSTVCFKGETLKNYAGKIACSTLNYNNRNNTPNSKRASTIKIGNVVSPANVTIHAYCRLAAEAASDVVSLDTLVMKTNSAITVVYDKSSKTASCVKVSGTFTHDEGPVKIEFEPNSTFGSWPDSEIVPELQVLKAPEGVTLSTNDFVLSPSAVFPVYDLYERTAEDGLSTLCIKQRGKVIKQTTSEDSTGSSGTTFLSGSHWDGGELPTTNNCYYSDKNKIRAYAEAFRGVAVTIADGAGIGVELQSDATSDLAKYGMDLRPAGSSLAIEAESLTPEVSFPAGGRGPLAAAICTVPAASAPALHSKLRAPGAVSEDLSVELFERTNADASVTFGIKVAKKIGLVIMVL